jgi:hypothetical protein
MTDVLLKQNDGRWGQHVLGRRMSSAGRTFTIGGQGCLLTCLSMAVASLKQIVPVPPDQLNDMLVTKGCFDGPLLYVEHAAREMGAKAPNSERVRATTANTELVADAIKRCFDDRKIAILHVDHDDGARGGDVFGDHFVVAFRRNGQTIVCGDPATATIVDIDATTVRGHTRWPKFDAKTGKAAMIDKNYTVVGVIPISL